MILITGASGFIGGAIAERLVDRVPVRSLTFHPARNRFGDRVAGFPYRFDDPARMAAAFEGVEIFVNTYYVRFEHGPARFARAVEHSAALLAAARSAGVRKIVHVSVSNADEASDLPYYSNKARIERLVRESGVEYTILRPAIVVGPGDILVNNIAYFLRRLPVFTIFGDGRYRVQPMLLDAFADIALEAIDGAYRNETVPVAGPRDYSFLEMVQRVRTAVGSRAAIVRAPVWLALLGLRAAGVLLRDVVLTSKEVKGLTREYLYVERPHRCGGDLSDWLADANVRLMLGIRYASELARHFRP